MCRWLLLLLWALLAGSAAGGSGQTYPHRTLLDTEGKYWLSWGRRDSRLAFRLEVRTAGYVGLGFSPTGAMAAADIVVGGVAQGRPYLQVSASPPGARPAAESCPVLSRSRRGCRATRGSRLALWPRRDAVAPRTPRTRSRFRSAPAPPEPTSRSPPPLSRSEFSLRETKHGRLQAVFRL